MQASLQEPAEASGQRQRDEQARRWRRIQDDQQGAERDRRADAQHAGHLTAADLLRTDVADAGWYPLGSSMYSIMTAGSKLVQALFSPD